MSRLFRIVFFVMILAAFGSMVSFADSAPIKINLDGKNIVCDSPPVIIDGRTLVPARAIFEAMGGTVNWAETTREVVVKVGETEVKLKIDSADANVNGDVKKLDVPAKIISSRTMIPIRFVSEAVGCKVSWDEKNRIVGIVSPEPEKELVGIESIEISQSGDQVIVEADDKIADVSSFKMSNPSRMVFDIKNVQLHMKDGTIDAGSNPYYKAIRYSQYTDDTVRIVADLRSNVSGSLSRSDTMKTAYLNFQLSETGSSGSGGQGNEISKEDQALLDQYGLTAVKAEARNKLVVIDPGHGGSDTGSRGSENGVVVLDEKEINLDIALRLQKMLQAAGASIYMIRTDDTTVPLYDRQDKANSLGASLYVAVHNNSYASSVPSGTEVLYHGKNDPPVDGISAVALAEDLQKTLTANLGLLDRGAKESPELAVLRRTVMPAVIIEGAFISNPGDLSYMKTDDFREKYAMSAAKCIIDALNNSVDDSGN